MTARIPLATPSLAILLTLLLAGRGLTAEANLPRPSKPKRQAVVTAHEVESLRLAVEDLVASHGPRYPRGPEFLRRLDSFEQSTSARTTGQRQAFQQLQRQALLANPLLDCEQLLLLKRRRGQLGLPVNHKCNTGIKQTGYDNEIAVLSPVRPAGRLSTLFRPPKNEYVGEIDLHFDADRLLFSMPRNQSWHIWEVRADGTGLRRISRTGDRDVDCFDGCYLPDGRIVFASTASYTAVPCWHGQQRACSLFLMDAEGGNMRQLCFDQDLDLHPAVLPTGQVIFSRWDYTGTMHMYLRPLMVMNPDGTGQRAAYGSNSYWPNALYYPRGIPGAPNKIVAIVAGYHGVPRMGELALLDITRGTQEAAGVVQRIPGRGQAVKTVIKDNLVGASWPKFLHPYPLSEKYFLVAAQPNHRASWGIYLVDVFDNMVPIYVDPKSDLFEPIPLKKTPRPPRIPDRVDLERDDAVVYLHDVHAGPGLAGVPRGTVQRMRVVAYHFGYPGLAGPDKIGCGGPWEVMRILGTVPVEADGSALFQVPANTPLCVQPLDDEGKAVQLMRSWFTAMPGETVSCVGCHEPSRDVPPPRYASAARRRPSLIEPWYGPPRGLDFERDVQPVLDRHCAGCHNGQPDSAGRRLADLRSQRHFEDYRGRTLTELAAGRLDPQVREFLGGTAVRYTPAYEALLPFVRRVGIEDDVRMLVPGEYHADTSELIQLLQQGHYGVQLDTEAWDRLITWIDLNAPCHGTWGEVAPLPDKVDRRRRQLQQKYGGPADDFEAVPELSDSSWGEAFGLPPFQRARPEVIGETKRRPGGFGGIPPNESLPDAPIGKPLSHQDVDCWGESPQPPRTSVGELKGEAQARHRQDAAGQRDMSLDLGGDVQMQLVRIPAGRFIMGSANGPPDQQPTAVVDIASDFWMSTYEVTNAQFRQFAPRHRTGYFMKRYPGMDGPGLALDRPRQPVVRVAWQQAVEYCHWLSERTGMRFSLPTEAQWECACRAGTASPLSFGTVENDFSVFANLADQSLARRPTVTGGLGSSITSPPVKGIILEAAIGGDVPCEGRFDDGQVATSAVGLYRPNAWGLFDMHGNVTEWTRSVYRPYPYDPEDGREIDVRSAAASTRFVVRGGSFCDRPKRAASAYRLSYPAWQRVHNVGFRVVAAVRPSS